jgi:hypothetical protein
VPWTQGVERLNSDIVLLAWDAFEVIHMRELYRILHIMVEQ